MTESSRKPVYPPVYFFGAAGLMLALDRWLPIMDAGFWGARMFGWSLIVIAVVGVMEGDLRFRQAGTTIKPFEPSVALVTSGIFSLSRNPIYLSLTLALAGLAFVLGSLSPVALVLAFPPFIQKKFILKEEEMLEERFGEKYTAYKRRVRRWL